MEAWLEDQARNLTRAIRTYDIEIYPVEADKADVGPRVVRFNVRLRPGETGQRLKSRAEDLQRVLKERTIPFVDNVPGTDYLGIDLARPDPTSLPLDGSALENLPRPMVGRLPFLAGKTPDGTTVVSDLAELPHLLVGGTTGSGKTVFLYSLMVSLMEQFGPDQLSMLVVDPKQTDFVYFEDCPKYLLGGEVVLEPEDAISWLRRLATEYVSERTQRLRQARARDIRDYNSRFPDDPMTPIVAVIDEYADLVQVLSKNERQDFEKSLIRLAQRARNVGIHLVVATQRPSASVLTTDLRTNLPGRVALKLPSHNDSSTILGRAGAENLLGKGDMLFVEPSGSHRLQSFWIGPDELQLFLQKRCGS
jgi:DNA segregation ATPase FtsK/SpoIIIE-like protein